MIASVGRLVPEQTHHRLVDAAALLHVDAPGLRLLIVGDGPLRATLETARRRSASTARDADRHPPRRLVS